MKKNTKKILAFSVLALFMFSFIMPFVMADNHDEVDAISAADPGAEALGKAGDSIKNIFGEWEAGEGFSNNFAKYLFLALVSMIVYSVADKIPGLGSMFKKSTGSSNLLGIVFSIIVGFLSMTLIKPEEIYAMMTGYSALGFVMGGFLPLIILLFFTINLATVSGGDAGARLGRRIMAIIMWAGFSLFAGMKAYISPPGSRFLSVVIVIASLAMLAGMKSVFVLIGQELSTAKKGAAKTKTQLATAKTLMDAEALEALSK